jgi:hypothetical protein
MRGKRQERLHGEKIRRASFGETQDDSVSNNLFILSHSHRLQTVVDWGAFARSFSLSDSRITRK